MGLVVVSSVVRQLSLADLDELQWEQFQHDELYHREIVRLTAHERWKHMALHFAKYAGNLAAHPNNDEVWRRTVIDVFIIALSTSNTFNVRASELFKESVRADSSEEFLEKLVIGAGQMAAACEKLDHIEAFPFREEVSLAVSDILSASCSLTLAKGWSIPELVRERLEGVKRKWIHHSRQ